MVSRELSELASLEEPLFHAARSLTDRTAREAFLEAACQGRPEVRVRVEALLTASEEAASFFGSAAGPKAPAQDLTCGGRLGDYELLAEVGRGGMGRVYRARQLSTQRIVALKVIAAGSAADPTQVRRFQVEAKAAAQLQHPNIVPIHEVGACEGVWFFSMGLIEGEALSVRLGRTAAPAKPNTDGSSRSSPFLTDSFSVRQFCLIARAVHYAHQQGVLHRDLKPANILLDTAGEPHLIDFGLAKVVLQDAALTRTADVMGTPSYMAPEQARGMSSSIATDVYGLGAILYELITGRPPFRAETPVQTLRQVVEQAPMHPSSVRPEVDGLLAQICLRCLEKDPQHRYPSTLALAEDLERWERGEPLLAKPPGALVRMTRWAQRNPLPASFILSLLLGFTVTLALLIQVNRERNKQAALAVELKHSNRESTRLLARAVGMVRENLETLWANGDRNSMLVGSDEIAALANRPVSAPSSKTTPLRYILGLMAEDSPTGRAQRYADMLAYLERELESRLGRPVRVDVRFYKYVGDCRADLCAGKVDFIRCGALPFLRSKQQAPGVQPLAVPICEPKLAVLFTRVGSEIRSVADLKGRRVAFGETNSTVSFRAQIELAQRGINASQLAGYDFLDSSLEFGEEVRELGFDEAIRRIGYLHSHAQVIEGVLSGRYDAGVAAFRAFQINHSRGLAAIADSEFVSSRSVWVARAGLEAPVVNGLREALTALRDQPWMALLPDHPVGYELMARDTFALEESWLDRIAPAFPFKPAPGIPVPSVSGKKGP